MITLITFLKLTAFYLAIEAKVINKHANYSSLSLLQKRSNSQSNRIHELIIESIDQSYMLLTLIGSLYVFGVIAFITFVILDSKKID